MSSAWKEGQSAELSRTQMRYLLAVYRLSVNRGKASSKEISSTLGVKKPSVAGMLQVLAEKGMVEKEHYGKVFLTENGRKTAEQAAQQTNLLAELMQERLDLPEPVAWNAACAAVSELTGNSI